MYECKDFDVRERLVGMFHAGTGPEVKAHIVSDMTSSNCIRVLIYTSAFGMGVNCKDCKSFHPLWASPVH